MAQSSYFYYRKKLRETHDKYENLRDEICDICESCYRTYGYRRVVLELRKRGLMFNHKTVQRLMAEMGLKCLVRRKKYDRVFQEKTLQGRTAPNLFQRNFKATRSMQKLVTDVTEINVTGEKVFLSPVMDLFNREIVSYTISRRQDLSLVLNMLDGLAPKIAGSSQQVILHSDRGLLYSSLIFQHSLKKLNITQSMSRKGNCLDNAVIEGFFGILKSELLYLHKFVSTDELVSKLNDYISFYNNHRIKENLHGLSPVDFKYKYAIY